MKVLYNLTASAVKSAWHDALKVPASLEDERKQTAALRNISLNSVQGWLPRGAIMTIAHEAAGDGGEKSGVFRTIEVSTAGLRVYRGDACIGIPIAEIIKLAESIEPELKPD